MLSKQTRNILVISPVPTHPLNAGNRVRIFALIESLLELGHSVSFLHVEQELGSKIEMREKWGEKFYSVSYKKKKPGKLARYRRKFQQAFNLGSGYCYSIDAWYDSSIDESIVKLSKQLQIDTVIVAYVWFSKVLELFEHSILKVIDTHDKFSNRHEHFLEKGQKPSWFSTTEKEESKGFARADVLMAIQDSEKKAFKKMTDAPVITVGHVVSITKPVEYKNTSGDMLFVASANEINVQGISWFISTVLPLIRKCAPSVKLNIVGTICEKLEDFESVIKLGRVQDLDDIYVRSAVVINPVTIYTGLSIKNLEALSFSKPLVTKVDCKPAQKDAAKLPFRSAVSAEEFCREVVEIIGDPEKYCTLSNMAYEYMLDWNRDALLQFSSVLDQKRG